jgi:hypothetical protein
MCGLEETGGEMVEYEGSCQCDEIAYKVIMKPLESSAVTACTCSICTRNGYHIVYVSRESVAWTRGWDKMKDFRFGPKRSDHKFCPECGSSMLVDPCYSYAKLEMFKGAPDVLGLNVSF